FARVPCGNGCQAPGVGLPDTRHPTPPLNIPSLTTSTNNTDPMANPLPLTVAATDADLIAAWQRGDERAAAELVERHARPLARFLAGAGAPETDVDDLVQETFVRAFRSVDRFRGQCQFRTWLMTIGGNVLKDFGRRAARRKVVPLDDAVRDRAGDPHDH